MFDVSWCCLLVLAAACSSLAQDAPRIISPSDTYGVYTGQTAYLKCRVTNLGSKMIKWTMVTHNTVIYNGSQLLSSDLKKYSMVNVAGQEYNLQISNVDKHDRGFYKCSIEGTDQQIITHLNVVDIIILSTCSMLNADQPELFIPRGQALNFTDCCIMENVTDSCLKGCYPNQINLSHFNATAACGTVSNLKGLSKCFTGGSNHDNCCLNSEVDILCLGFCHNEVPSTFTPEYYSKCFTDEVIVGIFDCFETGFVSLPSEPTEVKAMTLQIGTVASILMKWKEPKKNPERVTGYKIMYKSRTQTSNTFILIKDVNTHSYLLNGSILNLQADMDYKVHISALAEHGVSFGSVEVDVYLPPSTLSEQLNKDIKTCCADRIINEKCRNMLCHSRTWSHFNTYGILDCYPYLDDVFTCLVGERNHTNCCAAYDVSNECLPLCSGQPPPMNNSLIGCISQMGIIEACVQQGYSTLPSPPTQITITAVEATSAIIEFEPSSSSLLGYLAELREGNEDAPFETYMTIGISVHVVHLNDLRPNTYYWLRFISQSLIADSLPSETVTFLTYPGDYDITPEKVTNIPHNMTDCCIKTGMPEACWKGCEYRTNITSYYQNVIMLCFQHIGNVLSCATDGRDHSECCRNSGVQSNCIELCTHTAKGSLDAKFLPCIPDTAKGIGCFMEGIVNLPRHPDVVVVNVSKNSISLQWEQPKTSGLIDLFTINYNIAGSSAKKNVSTSKTFYILQNLEPGTPYEISITSSNTNGTSAPSPLIREYTLSDNIQAPPTLNKTQISGRALWQNISHCCENNVQAECLTQCLNEQISLPQHMTCINESHKMLACFADGKDHSLCCKKRWLPSECIPICAGHALETNITTATCMSYGNREIILNCFLENHDLIPDAPNNFGVKLLGSTSVKLQWSPAKNCNINCTYGVHYWKTNQSFEANSQYNILNTSIVLPVEPGNVYTFTVTANNNYGSSSPSAWQTLYAVNYEKSVYLLLASNKKWVENRQSANLICDIFGFDPDDAYKIEWFFNISKKLDNNGKVQLFIPSVDSAVNEGIYTCTVTDSQISSSGSLFLPIKYAPKFSQFKQEQALPGKDQSARIDCFFHGLPDSDPNKWTKDVQPINQNSKYTMSQDQNYETGITTYWIRIVNVVESDYGIYSLEVSNAYGSTKCQVNLSKPMNTDTTSENPGLKQCCIKNKVSSLCQELCDFHVNITDIVEDPKFQPCLKYLHIFFQCGADSVSNVAETESEHQKNSNNAATGVGIAVAVIAFIAILVVVIFFLHKFRSKLCRMKGSGSVSFENQGLGSPGQIKIQGVEDQYSYGRLQEDNVPDVQSVNDSSSAADSSFENQMYKIQQPSGVATLPVESHS